MKKQSRAFAPASIANLSCGFDVLGLALNNMGDEVVVEFQDKPGVSIEKIEGDNKKLTFDPTKNTATVGIISMLKKLQSKQGIKVSLYKNLPLGSGLGSSASSAVASVMAANDLLGKTFTKEQLLPFVIEAESIASGAWHADNVAPSLLGGLVLIKGYEPLDIIQIETKLDLHCVYITPDLVVNTMEARKVLSEIVNLKTAVKQWGHLAGMIAAFFKNDEQLLSRSMHDFIIEPQRAHLIPHFYEVKEIALNSGALGCSIAGSGPTIFAFTSDSITADKILNEMQKPFTKNNIKSVGGISKINHEGAKII